MRSRLLAAALLLFSACMNRAPLMRGSTAPARRGAVAALRMRSLRASNDTRLLAREFGIHHNLRDSSVLAAALEIGMDRTASEPARIYAFITLYTIRTGKYWLPFEHFVGEHDALLGADRALRHRHRRDGYRAHLVGRRSASIRLRNANQERRPRRLARHVAADARTIRRMVLAVNSA